MKSALVLGAGGFIGSHIVKRLKKDGYWVRGVDLKYPEFSKTESDEFIIGDLRHHGFVSVVTYNDRAYGQFDLIIQLAADMGGAGYIFTGEHDADVMYNSATINLNVLDCLVKHKFTGKIFYSSSACMYPEYCQLDGINCSLKETDAYPAAPDSEYGWEKLFSERLYLAYNRNYGIDVRIARFHNIFGEEGTYKGGKEKYPAAICRKVAEAKDVDNIIIWGDGYATRSFLYIDECVDGVMRLVDSDFKEPINIGSDRMVTVSGLAEMVIGFSGKQLKIEHDLTKPQGVRGRNSDNTLCESVLNWSPSQKLEIGMGKLYWWIEKQVSSGNI